MSFTSYAQNFEDVLLWRALKHVDKGRYVDIGAQHPSTDSVSKAFYDAGWRGVHVEAAPTYAEALRAARPDETVIQAAVCDRDEAVSFYEISGTGMSTGSVEVAQHHEKLGFGVRLITVPAVRLSGVLSEIADADIHWMKVDVEGMEADVLRSWDDNPARPWVVVVESTFPNTQIRTDDQWRDLLLGRGYHPVHFDGLSTYFVSDLHPELDEQFSTPPNVFDAFCITASHFSAQQLVSQRQQREEELARELSEARQRHDVEAAATAQVQQALQQREHELQQTLDRCATAERLLQERTAAEQRLAGARDELQRQLAESQSAEAAARTDVLTSETRVRELEDALDRARNEIERSHQEAAQTRARLHGEIESHRSENEKLRAALAQADALIRAARGERSTFWHRIGRSLGFERRTPAVAALLNWSAAAATGRSGGRSAGVDANTAPRGPDTNVRNPYMRANSLQELLAWDDSNFVRCAYVTILGRQPDPEGEAYYTDRLRRGRSKEEVLWQLRQSVEARSHDPGIAGLDRALKRAAWARKPAIGRLFRRLQEKSIDLGEHELQSVLASAAAGELSTEGARIAGHGKLSAVALTTLWSDFPSLLLTHVREK